MEFTEKELLLIELLANPLDKRSKEAKARACGYGKKTVYRLQKKDGWKQAVYTRMKENVEGLLPAVYGSLFHQAKAGDTKAAELILKAAGEIITGGGQINQTFVKHQQPEETLADRIDAAWAAGKRGEFEPLESEVTVPARKIPEREE